METDKDWLRAICADPADDVVRLAFADWLIDHGQPERGEFIAAQIKIADMESRFEVELQKARRQMPGSILISGAQFSPELDALRRREQELLREYALKWVEAIPVKCSVRAPGIGSIVLGGPPAAIAEVKFRRGFVEVVRCRLADWIGEECQHCRGRGELFMNRTGQRIVQREDMEACLTCHGTGRLNAHGPEIVRACPVRVVEVTDRRPWNRGNHRWGWTDDPRDFPEVPWYIPHFLWAFGWPGTTWPTLPADGQVHSPGQLHSPGQFMRRVWYGSEAAANAALSEALIAWVLSQLPEEER